MKIRIRDEEGRRFTIPLPLFMIKSRLFWAMIEKQAGEDAVDQLPLARAAFSELSDYVHVHGHFVLVDLQSADGSSVKVEV